MSSSQVETHTQGSVWREPKICMLPKYDLLLFVYVRALHVSFSRHSTHNGVKSSSGYTRRRLGWLYNASDIHVKQGRV